MVTKSRNRSRFVCIGSRKLWKYLVSILINLKLNVKSYINSVIQSLYYCKTFRDCLIAYDYPNSLVMEILNVKSIQEAKQIITKSNYQPESRLSDNLLSCLRDLFLKIKSQKKKMTVIAPTQFVQRLKNDNGIPFIV